MKKTGAALAVHALERLGVRYTFGIPGVHNIELYDALNSSTSITPVLVTHEGSAAFMADGLARASGGVGVLVLVPAAGLTHAASGIAEAFLGGIPMLVLSGGIRTDLDKTFQLHEIDQHAFMRPITKATFRCIDHRDIVPTLYEAYRIATQGEPGPVFVELPVNLQLFPGEVGEPPEPQPTAPAASPDPVAIAAAADLLLASSHPGLFLGWGARDALAETTAIAKFLQSPVATTLQGLSAFRATHRLHTGFGFGAAAVPAAQNAFSNCDALLAVGTRFAEIATGSFGTRVPANLVHIDINPKVFHRNYPARVAIEADARAAVRALLVELRRRSRPRETDMTLIVQIREDKERYRDAWLAHDSRGRVNPARFFGALRAAMPDDAIAAVDDGNHTYLAAELFPVHEPKSFIVPTDFNCMGFAVPAAIGAKFAFPQREVFAVVGDGAFLMTGMEILTAAAHGLGVVYYVFNDGALSQIAQAQQISYARAPCTAIGSANFEGMALATGAMYLRMAGDDAIEPVIAAARRVAAEGRPVIVDVEIDYSRRTAFTSGAVQTNFKRLPLAQRLRMASRAAVRHAFG